MSIYGGTGRYLTSISLGALGLRSSDIQASGDHAYVLFQDRDGSGGFYVLDGTRKRRLYVTFDGSKAETASTFALDNGTAYLSLFVGEFADQELPAAVALTVAERQTEAAEATGRPFLDGWLLFQGFAASAILPLAVRSSRENWSTDIRFRLLHPDRGRVKGHVSWQLMIDQGGDLHLILFAGTFGRDPIDGYWYLKVAADGAVGRPVRLRDPLSTLDEQQQRILTLSPSGTPLALFLDDSAAEISNLGPLEEISLPSS